MRLPNRPRRPLRSSLALEQLEDRTLLSGNLIITSEVPGRDIYNLMEYTQQGVQVSSQNIPQAPGANDFQDARGLTVDPSGKVHIVDGNLSPFLDTYSPGQQPPWSYQTVPGWGIASNITYGEAAAYKNFVFASNQQSINGVFHGIVRFDTSGGSPVLFAPDTSSLQITLGLDGELYELVNGTSAPSSGPNIEVFNPDTLALVRTIQLALPITSDIRSIAVDGSGNIYAADWLGTVSKYDANGALLKTQTGYSENLMNIAIDSDGQIAVGGRNGGVYLTDESLSSLRSIQTGQWNVFVTFDHYIGTAPQTVTPSFSSLAGPTIPYGQASVTLGGRISAGAAFPSGSVNISVNGVTKSAAVNPNNGTFSAVFDTSTLGVSGSPYRITYSYPGDSSDAPIQDTSHFLTVTPAATTLSSLASPTLVVGTPTITLSGVIGSNSVLPVGQAVTVQILGANSPLASGSGTIGSDGHFSVTLDTSALPVGSYTIQYAYVGDANFTASQGTGTLTVTYAINPLYDISKPVHAGAALPIKIQVADAAGNDLSSADLTVTAVALVDANGNTLTPQAKGNANPSNVFRQVGQGYLYNLNTAGLTSGKYTLLVRIGDDPVLHALSFVVE